MRSLFASTRRASAAGPPPHEQKELVAKKNHPHYSVQLCERELAAWLLTFEKLQLHTQRGPSDYQTATDGCFETAPSSLESVVAIDDDGGCRLARVRPLRKPRGASRPGTSTRGATARRSSPRMRPRASSRSSAVQLQLSLSRYIPGCREAKLRLILAAETSCRFIGLEGKFVRLTEGQLAARQLLAHNLSLCCETEVRASKCRARKWVTRLTLIPAYP